MSAVQSIFQSLVSTNKIDFSALSTKQNKAVSDILKCHTPQCGFNSDICEQCGHMVIHYNSCKNSNCPQCQAVNREKWILKRKFDTLNIPCFHIVFTVPSQLNPLFLWRPRIMYDILFMSVSQTLKSLSEDKKYLGAKIGFTSVLHTWGQNLSLHPHLHVIVSGGGMTDDGKWKASKKRFFLPVRVMSAVFRGKFLDHAKSSLMNDPGTDKQMLQEIIDQCYAADWVVYSKKPMKDPGHVIEYLGRYTHRIAISNGRILSHENGMVTFRYKDYRDHNRIKKMALAEEEFFRRFMLHILPKGMSRMRHYGSLGNRNKSVRLKILRALTETPEPEPFIYDPIAIISRLLKRDITLCPCCRQKMHPLKE